MSLESIFRGFLDSIDEATHETRSLYHLTLGGLTAALEQAPPDLPVEVWNTTDNTRCGLGFRHSYRGHHKDLAFEPDNERGTVQTLHSYLRHTVGEQQDCYKGGTMTTTEHTPLWLAPYGEATAVAMLGVTVTEDAFSIIAKKLTYPWENAELESVLRIP